MAITRKWIAFAGHPRAWGPAKTDAARLNRMCQWIEAVLGHFIDIGAHDLSASAMDKTPKECLSSDSHSSSQSHASQTSSSRSYACSSSAYHSQGRDMYDLGKASQPSGTTVLSFRGGLISGAWLRRVGGSIWERVERSGG